MKGMDLNKLMQQAAQMQSEMEKAQEELANETVEASAGGGMVHVVATANGEIKEVRISPEAVDPDDLELLSDMVVAAVNEALRAAEGVAKSRLGGMMGGLGGLLPGM